MRIEPQLSHDTRPVNVDHYRQLLEQNEKLAKQVKSLMAECEYLRAKVARATNGGW